MAIDRDRAQTIYTALCLRSRRPSLLDALAALNPEEQKLIIPELEKIKRAAFFEACEGRHDDLFTFLRSSIPKTPADLEMIAIIFDKKHPAHRGRGRPKGSRTPNIVRALAEYERLEKITEEAGYKWKRVQRLDKIIDALIAKGKVSVRRETLNNAVRRAGRKTVSNK